MANRRKPEIRVYYKVIYNPHMTHDAWSVRKVIYPASLAKSAEVERTEARFRMSMRAQGCSVGVWWADDWERGLRDPAVHRPYILRQREATLREQEVVKKAKEARKEVRDGNR